MAEGDDQERNEEPSEKRLREAREKGELPRSRELSTAIVVLAGVSTLLATREQMAVHAIKIMSLGIRYGREDLFATNVVSHVLSTAALEALRMLTPLFAVTIGAAFAAPALLGGLNFSSQALIPKFDRLDPLKGIGRIFSTNGLVELFKSLLKILLIGGVLVWFMRHSQLNMMAVGNGDIAAGIGMAFGIVGHAALTFACVLGLLGLLDAPWQKYSFNKRMSMSKQELKDEHKESEGSPELKGRVRNMQQQISRRRMMQDVPKADVIVVNPSHFAVALRYNDDDGMRAPRVIAKGMDVMAQQIRLVAAAHKIPLVEAAPLARALYHTTEVGRDIPASLFVAVAQVLAYVYRLKQAVAQGDTPPEPPKPEVDPDLLGPYRMR
jgi:flagellar biosynthesis protein FlhB